MQGTMQSTVLTRSVSWFVTNTLAEALGTHPGKYSLETEAISDGCTHTKVVKALQRRNSAAEEGALQRRRVSEPRTRELLRHKQVMPPTPEHPL